MQPVAAGHRVPDTADADCLEPVKGCLVAYRWPYRIFGRKGETTGPPKCRRGTAPQQCLDPSHRGRTRFGVFWLLGLVPSPKGIDMLSVWCLGMQFADQSTATQPLKGIPCFRYNLRLLKPQPWYCRPRAPATGQLYGHEQRALTHPVATGVTKSRAGGGRRSSKDHSLRPGVDPDQQESKPSRITAAVPVTGGSAITTFLARLIGGAVALGATMGACKETPKPL